MALQATGTTKSSNTEYHNFHYECQNATSADPKQIAKVLTGAKEAGPIDGPYLLCLHKKYNIQNNNGDINLKGLRASLNLFYTEDKTNLVMDNCANRPEGTTPEEAAIELLTCCLKYVKIPAPDPNILK